MPTDEEFYALRTRIDSLEAQVNNGGVRPNTDPISQRTPTQFSRANYWLITERASGGTFTATVDWEAQFEAATVTYYKYGVFTATGNMTVVNPSTSRPFRAELEFDSPVAKEVTLELTADWGAGGRVQYKINSQITAEKTGDASIVFNIRQGANKIVLMSDGIADRLELRGNLYGT